MTVFTVFWILGGLPGALFWLFTNRNISAADLLSILLITVVAGPAFTFFMTLLFLVNCFVSLITYLDKIKLW